MSVLTVIQGDKTRAVSFDGEQPLDGLLFGFDVHIDKLCGGKGICKKCTVIVNGKEELACQYVVSCDTEVVVPENKDILSVTGAEESGKLTKNLCLCLDIGTTTLALAIVSLDDGQIIKSTTASNPQSAFGADVISRIEFCAKNGASKLQEVLVAKIKEMAASLFSQYSLDRVQKMYVAGNTTMLHLFFGVDCSSLGISPYTPKFLDGKNISGGELGFENICEIVSLPCISAFVGADIVSGLGFVQKPSDGKYSLLVDLGTNAEIVLFSKDKYLCATAAAGPCFEGVNISSGMSATEGAVCAYQSGIYSTVMDAEPEGICATGLVDVIASLVRDGKIEASGYMETPFELCENVVLTPADIREFQLAKSAVMSAIECLLKHGGVEYRDVETMYVAGGFSAKLNVQNAAYVGLLPHKLVDVFVPVNNSSLLGTVKFALGKAELSQIVKSAEFIDLGADKIFSELFFKNMSF